MRRLSFVSCLILPFLMAAGCARKPYAIASLTATHFEIKDTLAGSSQITALLAPYKLGVDTQMKVQIGRTDIPLTKAQPESTLGNFMADAQLIAARKIDARTIASVLNYGGIRLPFIAAGPLTRRQMYELMPFDNMLTIAEIPGSVIDTFCNFMAQRKGWPVSGLQYTIEGKRAVNIRIGGEALDVHRVYKIALSDYLAGGGDNCDFLRPLRKRTTAVFLRDAMIDYVAALHREGQPLHPEIENRIQHAE